MSGSQAHCAWDRSAHRGAQEALALEEKTLQAFQENKPRKCMLDYVVEESAGREMSPEDRDPPLAKVSGQLCELAVKKNPRAVRRATK